jgi:hypothetical protein
MKWLAEACGSFSIKSPQMEIYQISGLDGNSGDKLTKYIDSTGLRRHCDFTGNAP